MYIKMQCGKHTFAQNWVIDRSSCFQVNRKTSSIRKSCVYACTSALHFYPVKNGSTT